MSVVNGEVTLPESGLEIRSVCELISEIRYAAPQSIALSDGDRKVTFAELDKLTDYYATALQARGVSHGSTVAICMERSVEWIATALASMRCGAAYVPLDPAWPDARVLFVLEDSSATLLIARRNRANNLPVAIPSIDPGLDLYELNSFSAFQSVESKGDDLAYIVYTSGTTGTPKGIEVTHANLANLVRWHLETFAINPKDRTSHLAGLAFDASVWEIWPNLCAGATLCLATDQDRSSPTNIHAWLLRERITVAFVPTVHVPPLIKMQWSEMSALRLMLTGGDTLHISPSSPLPFSLVNNYGPAECTVVATSGIISPDDNVTPSIGRAISGATIHILDEFMQHVTPGEIGEIFIGGAGVANGYRNLPDLTAEKFLLDPFATSPGARMYRTGDFGLQRNDGAIEFRGRHDRQVQLRGQRIELSEIESLLSRHPQVESAAVVLDQSGAGPSLVAYVVPRETSRNPSAQELQEYLLRLLPIYMVPATIVSIDHFPLTLNGKRDLTRLQSHTTVAHQPLDLLSATSQMEERLLRIVRELLDDQQITSSDNFFLSGGHSLLGMQLILRIQAEFEVEVSFQDLFQSPTVGRLATVVQHSISSKALIRLWQKQLEISPLGMDQDLYSYGADAESFSEMRERIFSDFGQRIPLDQFLSATTVRRQMQLIHALPPASDFPSGVLDILPKARRKIIFWIHYQNVELAKAIGDDMTFLSVILTPEDLRILGETPTLQQVARRIVPKILETQKDGPYVIGGLCVGGVLAYEVAHQLKCMGREVSLLVLLDPPTPEYLKLGPTPSVDLGYLRYLLQRAARLGPTVSAKYFIERLKRNLTAVFQKEPTRTIGNIAQSTIEHAAFNYAPAKYSGNVLLLLAAEHPPSFNFLPGWQAVTTAGLNAQYVNAHHRDLLGPKSVQDIADAIKSRLSLTTVKKYRPAV